MKESDELNTFGNHKQLDNDWRILFSELCYEVFYKNPQGRKLLQLLENRYFRSPVAHPGREPSWAYFNEGHNELIRSFTMGIQAHLSLSDAKSKVTESLPQKGRRKPTIRPIA